MASTLPLTEQSLTGWGRTSATTAQVVEPTELNQIQALLICEVLKYLTHYYL